ncbi:MAG TPA: thioredoxin family protein [Phycisphaerae bacterium]|nr:thioredoxin family protein [Phycisphaerae bacterium]
MRIEILGTGCPKCNALEAAARSAADMLGITYEFTHIKDITEITKRGVMMTPALVIDGEVKVSGKVPNEAEITTMLTTALAKNESA